MADRDGDDPSHYLFQLPSEKTSHQTTATAETEGCGAPQAAARGTPIYRDQAAGMPMAESTSEQQNRKPKKKEKERMNEAEAMEWVQKSSSSRGRQQWWRGGGARGEGEEEEGGAADGGCVGEGEGGASVAEEEEEIAAIKEAMAAHPLYGELVAAHVQCIAAAASLEGPVRENLLRRLRCPPHPDSAAALARLRLRGGATDSGRPSASASAGVGPSSRIDATEIDDFMANYLQSLTEWRLKMEELVLPQMTKAMSDLAKIETSFYELIGLEQHANMASTMMESLDLMYTSSDDEDATKLTMGSVYDHESFKNPSSYTSIDIKQHLGENYRENIFSIRDAIMKKRQGSRLQADISVLTKWWNENSNWPYPTEEEKRQMAKETGLEMRQINNWFINNRKRKWHREIPKK